MGATESMEDDDSVSSFFEEMEKYRHVPRPADSAPLVEAASLFKIKKAAHLICQDEEFTQLAHLVECRRQAAIKILKWQDSHIPNPDVLREAHKVYICYNERIIFLLTL